MEPQCVRHLSVTSPLTQAQTEENVNILGSTHKSSRRLSPARSLELRLLVHKTPRGEWKEEGKYVLTMYYLPGSL